MISKLLEPLKNSRITVEYTASGDPRLNWSISSGPAWGRWLLLGFLAFWSVGWIVGIVYVGRELINILQGNLQGIDLWIEALPRMFFLAFWTILGGVFVIGIPLMMLLKLRARITLTEEELWHEPGFWIEANPQIYRLGEAAQVWNSVRRSPKIRRIPWSDIKDIRIEQTQYFPLLIVDLGHDEIILDQTLRAPEREWLAEVLRSWAGMPKQDEQRA